MSDAQVLVVAAHSRRRTRCASAFRAAGCRVFEGGSTRDVVDALTLGRTTAWVIAIVDTNPPEAADRLRDYLHGAYPEIPQIAVGESRMHTIAGRINLGHTPELAAQVHRCFESHDAG